ncbi:hypothetical protein [Streptomyces anulatus]|uniref:hypothetical protein n=1 Tax=Streptomyces anulatus TaxID=1892 RepID=UPI001C268F1F|nr:hypothetical protein [Streptomyces anulatus]
MDQLITLPLTSLEVPHSRYRLTNLRQITMGCDVAFTVNVREGRVLLGVIENHGNGGDTWFNAATFDHRQAMREFTASCRWKGEPTSEEDVYGHLVDEHELSLAARRCARTRKSLLRGLDADGDTVHTTEAGAPSVWLARGDYPYMNQLARELRELRPSPGSWQVWDGEQWKDLKLPTG